VRQLRAVFLKKKKWIIVGMCDSRFPGVDCVILAWKKWTPKRVQLSWRQCHDRSRIQLVLISEWWLKGERAVNCRISEIRTSRRLMSSSQSFHGSNSLEIKIGVSAGLSMQWFSLMVFSQAKLGKRVGIHAYPQDKRQKNWFCVASENNQVERAKLILLSWHTD